MCLARRHVALERLTLRRGQTKNARTFRGGIQVKRAIVGLFAVVVLWGVGPAAAEPYLAIREGYKCSACHVNMTGGGMRTSFVSAHARELLHYPNWFDQLTKPAEAFSGEVNQYVALGADLRTDLTFILQDKGTDGTVKNNVPFRWRLDETDVNVEEAVGYLQVNLIPDLLTFYLDQRFAPSLDTREVWAMMYLPYDIYVKGGQMFLPYGLQLQDDDAFIRGGRNGSATTGFSFNVSQPAFEFGWEPGPMSIAIAASQGVVDDRDVQVTGTISALFDEIPVVRTIYSGLSGSYSGGDAQTSWIGLFTGFNLGRFTYLGEVDFGSLRVTDTFTGQSESPGTFITYSEGNYLFFDWLNAKIAFDYADYDGVLPRQGSDAENRWSFGLEPFLARFLQVRAFYRVSNGIQTNPSHNQSLWSLEIHAFF